MDNAPETSTSYRYRYRRRRRRRRSLHPARAKSKYAFKRAERFSVRHNILIYTCRRCRARACAQVTRVFSYRVCTSLALEWNAAADYCSPTLVAVVRCAYDTRHNVYRKRRVSFRIGPSSPARRALRRLRRTFLRRAREQMDTTTNARTRVRNCVQSIHANRLFIGRARK